MAPTPAPVVATPTPAPASATASAPAPAPAVSAEAVAALTSMGFPEPECRAALQAAGGNPDIAYEFLCTGIPERAYQAAPPAVPTSGGSPLIQQFRSHPQFNALKELIQRNPAALPQVLSLIGQQSPQLLEAIHANQPEFLAMMNEPISATPAPTTAPAAAAPGFGGAPSPQAMLQMIASLPPEQRAAFASSMGMQPHELQGVMQMMASMPPEYLQQALQGMGGQGGGPPPGSIALTQAEMDAVNRLMALGFSQAQAAQAFLACDRNEELAANFLFDGGMDGDGDFDGGEGGGPDDDMYS